MRLIPITDYRREYFAEGHAPSVATVRRQIVAGVLEGRQIGRKYYVDAERFEQGTGNDLADRVLEDCPR